MAVGDIVNGLHVGTGGNVDFQPAVGVSICITSCGVWGSYVMITNGTITSTLLDTIATGQPNTKLMIDNTNYLQLYQVPANGGSYSGIQIK